MKPFHRQREVGTFRLPNAIPLAPTENKQMKIVKELFQDIIWFAVALYAFATIREKGGAE